MLELQDRVKNPYGFDKIDNHTAVLIFYPGALERILASMIETNSHVDHVM
jgi:hypothetical protein